VQWFLPDSYVNPGNVRSSWAGEVVEAMLEAGVVAELGRRYCVIHIALVAVVCDIEHAGRGPQGVFTHPGDDSVNNDDDFHLQAQAIKHFIHPENTQTTIGYGGRQPAAALEVVDVAIRSLGDLARR
jgi:hypothetical protein